jgi:hypothetical protein
LEREAHVPFDRIASPAPYGEHDYPTGVERAWQGRLSADDQREFDNNYAKWLEDTRKNDRCDIDRDVRHMQEIMARKSWRETAFGLMFPSIELHPRIPLCGTRGPSTLKP